MNTSDENTMIIHDGQVTEKRLSDAFNGVSLDFNDGILQISVPENKVITKPFMLIFTGAGDAEIKVDLTISAHSVLNLSQMVVGDGNLKLETVVKLVGNGASSEVKTVALAGGSQKCKLATKIENLASHTTANIVNHGVVKDDAHLAFDGTGKIHKGMKGSDAQQETRLLNLSKTAEATANPFLLIDEGDITAGHAASIGRIDEEQIYYLMSRGMSKPEAEKLIVTGFLTPFVDSIDDEVLRERLLVSIERKLG